MRHSISRAIAIGSFLAAGFVLIRQTTPQPLPRIRDSHAGENEPGTISLERLRALGS